MNVELTRSAWVWRTRHLESIQRWAMSAGQSTRDFEEASEALRYYLERAPANAGDVARLAMNVCLTSQRRISPEALQPFVGIARDASLLDEATAPQHVVALLCYAQSLLAGERRIDGLETLRKCEALLNRLDSHDPILEWTRGKAAHLAGGLWEMDLERERARESYAEALEIAQQLLEESSGFEAAWVQSYFGWMGDGVRIEDFGPLARAELERLYTDCAVGRACNTGRDAPAELRTESARAACEAIERFGPSPDVSPWSLAEILAPVDPGEAKQLARHLLDVIEDRRESAAATRVPDGLTYGPAVEIAERALRSAHERMVQQAKVWNIAALIGLARATLSEGDVDGAHELFLSAVKAAIENRQGLPQAVATGALLAFEAANRDDDFDTLTKMFLVAFAGTADVEPGIFDAPAMRTLVDDAVAVVAMHSMQAVANERDAANRQRSSLLIDLLRRPESPPARLILQTLGVRDADGEKQAVEETSLVDKITGRLAGKSAAALVLQSLADGIAMLAITGRGETFYSRVGTEYLDGVDALDSAVQLPLFSAMAGATSQYADRTREAGAALFGTLPDQVQAVLRDHDTLFLVPDFRGVHSVQPFELMHDGKEFIGLAKIVTRTTSLSHLAEVLAWRPEPARHTRALVTSAPAVDGYATLQSAARECESIRQYLDDHGYDAPRIEPGKLTADFYRRRLQFIDVLHIAAHGEAIADAEWLVLPGGERLVVDDLLSLDSESLPFVYLSTCNLARTRHLGAGISRGLAYTFVDQGSPAVVSNSTPVLDFATLELATTFYKEAMHNPVGEALRRARRASEVSAATWGRAVLFGNPWHSLPRSGPA